MMITAMEVHFRKLHENAVVPSYAKAGDAGLDLTAVSHSVVMNEEEGYYYVEYGTGWAVEIPEGFMGLLFPRSSISKTGLILANSVGIVDEQFRGEIKLRFKLDSGLLEQVGVDKIAKYYAGDRVGQLVIVPRPTITPLVVDELSETDRGVGGFGSTGN